MPHLTLEYSANLDGFDALHALRALNRALAATGQFEEFDIKSRAFGLNEFMIGTVEEQRAFVHARLAILGGRTPEIKQELSGVMLRALQSACAAPADVPVQLCAEIVDIDRPSYAKNLLLPAS